VAQAGKAWRGNNGHGEMAECQRYKKAADDLLARLNALTG